MIDDFHGNYLFLSNFYECPFYYLGREWKSVEHAFQAAKCQTAEDYDKVHAAPNPGAAKRLGRRVALIPDWDRIRIDVMRDCLLMKFLGDDELLVRLLSTVDEELIEGNTWNDRFWGCVKNADNEWKGQNNLGKLLMEIRANVRSNNYCWVAIKKTENIRDNNGQIIHVFKDRNDAMNFIAKQPNTINPFESEEYRVKPMLYGY